MIWSLILLQKKQMSFEKRGRGKERLICDGLKEKLTLSVITSNLGSMERKILVCVSDCCNLGFALSNASPQLNDAVIALLNVA